MLSNVVAFKKGRLTVSMIPAILLVENEKTVNVP